MNPWQSGSFPITTEAACRFRAGPSADAPLVLLCHGMGEDPERCSAAWPKLLALPVHAVLPAGPFPFEVREESGIRIGHAWYLYDGGQDLFRRTLDLAEAWLHGLLRRLEATQGWEPRDRAVVGHSQGAYFGGVLALRHQDLFERLVCVSGRVKMEFARGAVQGALRALVVHGATDRSVPADAARESVDALRGSGYDADLLLLPGGHRLAPDRDVRVADWLARSWGLEDTPSVFG